MNALKIIFLFLAIFILFTTEPTFAATGLFMDLYGDVLDNDSGWYMETMQIPAAQQYSKGAGVTVALIDSGVELNHPALSHCIDTTLSYNVADDDYDVTDYLGHGTMMAGLICGSCDTGNPFCGVAPEVNLIVYKIVSGSGFTFQDYDLAEAIRLAADSPATIINLSLVIGDSELVAEAVNYALSQGKIVVAAAGNQGGYVAFPAEIDGVVATGSVYPSLTPVDGSGVGPYLIVSAPGYNIGTTTTGGEFGATTGTSAASALIAGTFALVQSRVPELTPGIQRAVIAQATLDEGWPGFDIEFGFGIVNTLYSVTGTNPLQTDLDQQPSVYLADNNWSYTRSELLTLTLGLNGVGGHEGDLYVQETDPRGVRFYFQYWADHTDELPYPYNRYLGSPFLFPGSGITEYPLFSTGGNPLLSNGAIAADAAEGLYEMTVGVELDGVFYYSRVVIWIGESGS